MSSSRAMSRPMARSFFPSYNWYTCTCNLLCSSLSLIISSSSALSSACSCLFSLKVGLTSSSCRHWCSIVFYHLLPNDCHNFTRKTYKISTTIQLTYSSLFTTKRWFFSNSICGSTSSSSAKSMRSPRFNQVRDTRAGVSQGCGGC
jgi:hypothetical protein